MSSTDVSAFLTAQGMFLTLRHLEHAFIKFLRLVVPHVLLRDDDPTMEIFSKSWAGKLPLLLWFGNKYPFKSICPNYLCIQELMRTQVESTNPSHSLVSLQKPVQGHFPYPCKLFPNFSNFLYFPFSVSFFLRLFFPTFFSFSELFLGMGIFKSLVDSKEGMEKFRADYRIPPNVGLKNCEEGEWHFLRQVGEVVIPMIAFIECGIRIPMGWWWGITLGLLG